MSGWTIKRLKKTDRDPSLRSGRQPGQVKTTLGQHHPSSDEDAPGQAQQQPSAWCIPNTAKDLLHFFSEAKPRMRTKTLIRNSEKHGGKKILGKILEKISSKKFLRKKKKNVTNFKKKNLEKILEKKILPKKFEKIILVKNFRKNSEKNFAEKFFLKKISRKKSAEKNS